LSDRKNSIRKKYNLQDYVGKLDNELKLMEGTNFVMQLGVEDLQKLTVGNIETFTLSIKDKKVVEYMKSLRFSYKREIDYAKS
jgi:hypothetical protein